MGAPAPSLNNWKGILVIFVAIAAYLALTKRTKFGQGFQGFFDDVAGKIPG